MMIRSCATALLLTLLAAPGALADETMADCEAGQPWVGHPSTRMVPEVYDGLGRPGEARMCEGEHWDGQDQVQPASGASESGVACLDADPDADDLFVGYCMGPTNGAERERDFATVANGSSPAGARLGSTGGDETFAGVDAMFVGKAMLYVGAQDGLTVGLYVRDNTPSNLLATAVSGTGITRGYVAEGDCTHEEYERQDPSWQRPSCGRDNTAVTVELLG